MQLTVDVNVLDDAGFDPSAHPHAPSGSAHGGQFTKKGGITLASPGAGKNAVIRELHKVAIGTLSPEDKAKKLKDISAKQKAPVVAQYANKILGELETAHALGKGSLGKATPKGEEAAPPGKPLSSPLAALPVTGFLPPNPKKLVQGDMYKIANSTMTLTDKIFALQNKKSSLVQADNINYANHLLTTLGAGGASGPIPPAPKPASSPPPMQATPSVSALDLPPPFEGSTGQQALFEAAAKGVTKGQQLASLKSAMASLPANAAFTLAYGNKLIAALGGTPATATTPPPSNKLTTKRPKDLKLLEQIKTAVNYKNDPGAITSALPSYSKAVFDKLKPAQRGAILSYTGSGYGSMNAALRNPENASEHVSEQINHIDEAFDEPEATVTKDLVTERGQAMLADTEAKSEAMIKKIVAGLKMGLPVDFSMRGFVSTSIANPFSSKIKMTILVTKGTSALYVGAISHHQSEKELLLRHHQQFRVLDYENKNGSHHLTLATTR